MDSEAWLSDASPDMFGSEAEIDAHFAQVEEMVPGIVGLPETKLAIIELWHQMRIFKV